MVGAIHFRQQVLNRILSLWLKCYTSKADVGSAEASRRVRSDVAPDTPRGSVGRGAAWPRCGLTSSRDRPGRGQAQVLAPRPRGPNTTTQNGLPYPPDHCARHDTCPLTARALRGPGTARRRHRFGHNSSALCNRFARNRLVGLVTEVQGDTTMAQVEMQCGPHRVVSLISREAVDDVGLRPCVLAVAVVKSTNVVVGTRPRGRGRGGSCASSRRRGRRIICGLSPVQAGLGHVSSNANVFRTPCGPSSSHRRGTAIGAMAAGVLSGVNGTTGTFDE